MDIRSFFGAGNLKKDIAKKQESTSRKASEKSKSKETLQKKSDANHPKASEKSKKNESKIFQEMSDEEVDFKKSKMKSKSFEKKSEEKGKKGGEEKVKGSRLEKTTKLCTDEVEEPKNIKKKTVLKKKVSRDEEEDEDVMNVKKKHKPMILPSDSEDDDDEDPLPKSMRGKKGKAKSPLNDSRHNMSIEKAFTKVVPKPPTTTTTTKPPPPSHKKEARTLVNAVDFFGSEPVACKEERGKGRRDVEKVRKGELKEKSGKGGGHDDDDGDGGGGSGGGKSDLKVVKEEVVVEDAPKTLAEKLAMNKKRMSGVKEEGVEAVKKEREEGVEERGSAKKGVKEREGEGGEREVVKKEKEDGKREVVKKEEKEDGKKKEESGGKKKKRKAHEEDGEEEEEASAIGGDDDDDNDGKKKKARMAYAAFKQREPPKALGSRQIPQGAENCLEGLTFVLTGVYETVERDEVKRVVERLGGKVTTAVSRNTDYLVVGRDAGASKVDKAKQLGTKQVDEDALFDLIAEMPAKRSKYEIQAEKEARSSSSSTPKSSKKASRKSSGSPQARPSKHPSPSSSSSHHPSSSSSSSSKKPSTATPTPSKTTTKTKSPSTTTEPSTTPSTPSLLWTDKYKPTNLKQLVGQQGAKSQANKLMHWLQHWHENSSLKAVWGRTNEDGVGLKAALLSGPPGVGKTTTAQVVCKELSFSYVELNASDTRSKRSLKEEVAHCLNNQSLITLFGGRGEGGEEMTKHCLIMDEVDGMSGNEDRGGMQELIQLIKSSQIPIICLCNDRNHPKIRSLANYCFDLRFQRPRVEMIKSAIMSIAYKEGLKIPPSCLNDVITAANHDLRQILLNMSMWTVRQASPTYEEIKKQSDNAKKDMHYSPFDVCRRVFSNDSGGSGGGGGGGGHMSLVHKSDLFFHDYNIAPLFVQENYLTVNPMHARGDMKRHLALLAKAADSICHGDAVDAKIRGGQMWSLLPLQAMYASVLPGEYMRGGVGGMVQFPAWLGKNSTRNKNDRLLQELNLHTRISIKGNKSSLNLDYLPAFKHLLTTPLLRNDPAPAIDLMTSYDLIRDDLENIKELSHWSTMPDLFAKVDSKTKANLTRQFNKQCHLTPYSTSTLLKKANKKKSSDEGGGDDDDYGGDEAAGNDDNDDEAGDDDDDPASDAMIVTKKPTKGKAPAATKAVLKKAKGKNKK